MGVLLRWLARLVALFPFAWLARGGAVLGLLVGSGWRVRRTHVEHAIGRAGISAPRKVARGMYASLGTALLEFLWLAARPSERLGGLVRLTARATERLRRVPPRDSDALSGSPGKGRGAVIATAHTGNWDLLACAAQGEGLALTVVTKRLRVGSLDQFWQRERRARGIGLVDGEGAFRGAREALQRGDAVAMMIDQAPERRSAVTEVSFLGAKARCDLMPILLAARAGVPLLLVLGHRDKDGLHVVDVPLVIEPPRHPSQAWLQGAARDLTRALEAFVLAHPEQWLWLHRRWKTYEERPCHAPGQTLSLSS